ncbi:hypothetical protein TNCV_3568931 [Trichonephila clavipes]|nr:hypothetical protein TNCV_3568931 [Trichonephila clavipes]
MDGSLKSKCLIQARTVHVVPFETPTNVQNPLRAAQEMVPFIGCREMLEKIISSLPPRGILVTHVSNK